MSDDRKTQPRITQSHDANWVRIQDVFEKAVTVSESGRAAVLDTECAGEKELRNEVECLLQSYDAGEREFEVSAPYRVRPIGAARTAPGYQLLSEIHRGGQGVVFRAVQLSTKREVAIKFLLAGSLAGLTNQRRFEREVELVSNLSHPGIVPIFDSGLNNDQYFFAMEYVDGESLDVLQRFWREPRRILSVFVELCEAIGHAHAKGVVHRDLKPSNILIGPDERPRVLDFGLAKSRLPERDTPRLSMTGQVMGTPAYMSPEQAAGQPNDADARSDVYSLGVILYELLTQCLPYELGETLPAKIAAIRSSPPDRAPLRKRRVATDVSTIIFQSLAKEKERRYRDAGEMGDDIRRYLRGEPIEARRDSTIYVLRKKATRHRFSLLIATMLLAGIGIGGWLSHRNGDPFFAPPLRDLAPGDFYSASDLEKQAKTLKSMVDSRQPVASTISEMVLRFTPLGISDFEDSINQVERADLKVLCETASFLKTEPSSKEIVRYLDRWRVKLNTGRVESSGLVNDVVTQILQSAIATPHAELYAKIPDATERELAQETTTRLPPE